MFEVHVLSRDWSLSIRRVASDADAGVRFDSVGIADTRMVRDEDLTADEVTSAYSVVQAGSSTMKGPVMKDKGQGCMHLCRCRRANHCSCRHWHNQENCGVSFAPVMY